MEAVNHVTVMYEAVTNPAVKNSPHMHSFIHNLSMHEQSKCEGHSQAPVAKVLLTVHGDVGVALRETHEQGSFAGHTVKRRSALVLWLSEILQCCSERDQNLENITP